MEMMDALIRRERLLEEIRPYYPKAGKGESALWVGVHSLGKNENRLALLLVHGIAGMPIRASPGFMLHRGPGAGPRLGRRGG